MSSLKEALARKQQRETHYDLLIADPTEAEEALEQARQAERRLKVRENADPDDVAAAKVAVDEARAALTACVHRIRFRNLPPDEFEALVGAHEPTPEQLEKGDQWNTETFRPALIAACAVDSDMTEQEWAAELASERWSVADRGAVFLAALQANVSPRSVTLPKG